MNPGILIWSCKGVGRIENKSTKNNIIAEIEGAKEFETLGQSINLKDGKRRFNK